jgi:hypothetical protein
MLNIKLLYEMKRYAVKARVYFSEGAILNECKIKEMKIYVDIEIKYVKLIQYYFESMM